MEYLEGECLGIRLFSEWISLALSLGEMFPREVYIFKRGDLSSFLLVGLGNRIALGLSGAGNCSSYSLISGTLILTIATFVRDRSWSSYLIKFPEDW